MKRGLFWALAVAILVFTSARAARAHARRAESKQALTTVEAQARELVRLRGSARDSSLSARPEGGLAGKVARALASSGLLGSALQSLSPEAESTDKGLVRQHATLTLSGPTLPQVGKFLDAWRTAEPEWIISGLDLSPAGTGTPGADVPLRAVVTMDAVFRGSPKFPGDVLRLPGDHR